MQQRYSLHNDRDLKSNSFNHIKHLLSDFEVNAKTLTMSFVNSQSLQEVPRPKLEIILWYYYDITSLHHAHLSLNLIDQNAYTWNVLQQMGKVPPTYIFGAFIPAVMVAGLFFFEHKVASKPAQQKEFNLKNPSAYHYDIFLLGIVVCKWSTFNILRLFIVAQNLRQQFAHIKTVMACRPCSVVCLDFRLLTRFFPILQCILRALLFSRER